MDKGQVIKILKFYSYIDKDVQFNRRIISDLEERYYSGFIPTKLDGMPRGKGLASSPVENIVLNIPETVRLTIREMEEQNKRLCKIKSEILKELSGLNHVARVIIFAYYVEGQKWGQIMEQISYSERQCKNIRNSALEQLALRFARNKAIRQHKFPY